MASREKHGFGLNCVELKESGVPIGTCGLIKRPDVHSARTVGGHFPGLAIMLAVLGDGLRDVLDPRLWHQ